MRRLKITRDLVLFVAGLAGIAYVTVTNGADRPTLLILFGAMVGLPAILSLDERKKTPSDQGEHPPTKGNEG